jgi:hypothetical protein
MFLYDAYPNAPLSRKEGTELQVVSKTEYIHGLSNLGMP